MMININCKECNIIVEVPNNRTKYCSICVKEKQLARARNYKKRNKEKIAEYNFMYKSKHADKLKEQRKIYDKNNREKIQEQQTARHKERRQTDMRFKMSVVLRNRFRKFYTGVGSKSMSLLLECTMQEFLSWIEYNFKPDMCWDNHGTLWHIDHVIPCALFDLTCETDQEDCFNWRNTRPLYASINMSRGSNIELRDLMHHELSLYFYNKNHLKFGLTATKFLRKL